MATATVRRWFLGAGCAAAVALGCASNETTPGGGTGGAIGTGGSSAGSGGAASGGASGTGGTTGSGGAMTDAAIDASGPSDGPPSDGGAGEDGGSGGPGLAAWKYFKTLTLDTTATGANVAGDVAKYPVAVILNSGNFDFTQAKEMAADLRFSTIDGTLLPFAVEQWDRAAGAAALWVKVDVKGNGKATVVMSWGNAAASSVADSTAVFDTKDGFLGVWHLAEAPGMTAGGFKDATSNAANLTGVATAAGSTGDGRIGKAASLTAGSRQWIRLDGAKNSLFDVTQKVTYSIWSYARSYPGEYVTPFAKGDNSWRIHMYGSSMWDENKGKHIVEMCCETTGNEDLCAINMDPSLGSDVAPARWFHWVGVLDYPKLTLYLNGVQEITMNSTATWKSDAQYPVGIGNNSQIPSRFWDGLLDEARVMNVAKDANWIKLEYESQREGQKFLTFGATQTRS